MKHQPQDRIHRPPGIGARLISPVCGTPPRPDEVAILLALHDGARFVEAQLDSLAAQTHSHWQLIVSDDGSSDDGPGRVEHWARRHPQRPVRLIAGPGRGFAHNFLHLVSGLSPASPYVAFCDQDDVWLPEKLERAVAALSGVPGGQPAICTSARLTCDAGLGSPRMTERWPRPASFANALVQNVTPGNTLVMNRAALRLLQAAARRLDGLYAHDWWAYLMVTGAGGRVIRDSSAGLLYRQHDANAIGARHGLRGWLAMLRFGLRGDMRRLQDTNLRALTLADAYLTPENRDLLAGFAAARNAPWYDRPARLRRLGIYHQTRAGTAGLWFTAALGLL